MTAQQLRLIFEPVDPVANVYWFTHAGGGTSALMQRFRDVDLALPVRVHSPWMPRREKLVRQAFEGDLPDLARLMVDQIADRQQVDSLPLVLVGHSFGGALAFRIASELVARGIPIHRLIVLATPSPQSEADHRDLHSLTDSELIVEVDNLFGGIPEEILGNPDLQQLFAPALRCDLRLLEMHRELADPIDVPLTAVYGNDDRQVGISRTQGWRQWTASQFRLRSMPGDHFFPFQRTAEIIQLGVWDALPG
ncbi:MAG: thioesterase II family protein [Rubripirellula sp.]